jgi:hypothetical protein
LPFGRGAVGMLIRIYLPSLTKSPTSQSRNFHIHTDIFPDNHRNPLYLIKTKSER